LTEPEHSNMFYVLCIMRCDIIVQHKPTKCTLFQIEDARNWIKPLILKVCILLVCFA